MAAPGSARAGCVLLILCSPAPKSATPAPAVKPVALPKFFAPDSVWNTPLADDAPLSPYSSQLVATLQQTLISTMPWINTTSYSVPVYTVPAGQKTVKVTLRNNKGTATQAQLQSQFNAVPIPSGATASGDSDASMVIWQPSSDTLWEMWQVKYNWLFGWSFAWGGRIQNVSASPGIIPSPLGATATGLPWVGGLMSISELQAGSIDHALAFVVPHPAAYKYVWPAQRTDGDGAQTAIPEGTRFRLPAGLNIDALGLSPVATMMAKAVQRYGMILHDKGGAVGFFAEDPTQYTSKGATNPYPALFGGQAPDKVLAGFPWSQLEAVSPQPAGATVTNTATPAVTDSTATLSPQPAQPGTPQPVSGPMRRLDF